MHSNCLIYVTWRLNRPRRILFSFSIFAAFYLKDIYSDVVKYCQTKRNNYKRSIIYIFSWLIVLVDIIQFSIPLTWLRTYKAVSLDFVSSTGREVYAPEKEYSLCFWIVLQSPSISCHSLRASSASRLDIPSVSHCTVELYKSLCETPLYFLVYAIFAMLKAVFEGLLTVCSAA